MPPQAQADEAILAARPFTASITGDRSPQHRPMGRAIVPLDESLRA